MALHFAFSQVLGIEKMFSLETGEAAIKKAHRQFSLRNMVKAVCRIEAQPYVFSVDFF